MRRLIAGCGYHKLRPSEKSGVLRFTDALSRARFGHWSPGVRLYQCVRDLLFGKAALPHRRPRPPSSGVDYARLLTLSLDCKIGRRHNSTSAFAPKHYPETIIRYANSRSGNRILYPGYFPMDLSLERIITDMKSFE